MAPELRPVREEVGSRPRNPWSGSVKQRTGIDFLAFTKEVPDHNHTLTRVAKKKRRITWDFLTLTSGFPQEEMITSH